MAGTSGNLSSQLKADTVMRPARPGDEPALAAIDTLVNPSPWTANQFALACAGGGHEQALVVDGGRYLVGFVVFSLILDEACIHNVAVHPEWQGKGLGSSLLHAALDAARSLGASRCCLEVRQSNLVARRLYAAQGFQQDGLRRNYYPAAGVPGAGHPAAGVPGAGHPAAGDREDAVLLSRQL